MRPYPLRCKRRASATRGEPQAVVVRASRRPQPVVYHSVVFPLDADTGPCWIWRTETPQRGTRRGKAGRTGQTGQTGKANLTGLAGMTKRRVVLRLVRPPAVCAPGAGAGRAGQQTPNPSGGATTHRQGRYRASREAASVGGLRPVGGIGMGPHTGMGRGMSGGENIL